MQCNQLQDLALAGVRWELSDVPFAMAQSAAVAAANRASHPAPTAVTPDVVPDSPAPLRAATAIVPPIAPEIGVTVQTARAMAARPSDMAALARMIAEFGHPLRSAATNVVLPHIAPNPNGLVIITDIPSADDDANGEILTGAAGELLDKMLAAIGMSRDSVSILPMVFWRTPGGRTPSRNELDLARPFVNRTLEFLSPRLILTLGTLPATEIADINLARTHGVVADTKFGVKCMPIFHPNYLLLKPTAKRDAWNALQQIQNLLKSADK